MAVAEFSQQSEDYRRIEKAIRFIEDNFKSQPGLDKIAQSVHLSPYHFNRMFKRWAGISPIRFLHFLTLDFTKQRLAESQSLLSTALDAGLSGPGRLHDLYVTFEAMTPGEYKQMGAGVKIMYGYSPSPFGECLLAVTGRGICHLGFVIGDNRSELFRQLRQIWPDALFIENRTRIRSFTDRIFSRMHIGDPRSFHLHLKGTNFQIKVWQALLTIPAGKLVCYQDVATYLGNPQAFRAVANAVAANPVAYLIPCHRVIAKSGRIHHYRYGCSRKKAIIGWETAGSIE